MRMEIIPSPGLGQREPLVNEYTAQFPPSLSVCVPIPIIRVVFFLARDVPAVTAEGAVTWAACLHILRLHVLGSRSRDPRPTNRFAFPPGRRYKEFLP